MSLPQTSLEEAYGRTFGGRPPIRESGTGSPGPIAQPEFTSLAERAQSSIKSNAGVIQNLLTSGSLPIAGTPRTQESFRVEEPKARIQRELVRTESILDQREAARESFTERPVPSSDDDKLTRILRLIEQNKTGYERPVTQDMLLYVFTGVFFLFTLDTFVLLGKSMRRGKKA